MEELDFITFGINPDNQKLLRRIYEAVSELHTFGDLELRSAWLYYGSISAASKALNIPASTYQRLMKPQRFLPMNIISMTDNPRLRWESIRKFEHREGRWQFRKLTAFQRMSDSEWGIIADGARMITELPDAERATLFPITQPLPICRESYVGKVESWRKVRSHSPVAAAEQLLKHYILGWYVRKHVRTFFQSSGTQRTLKKALACRDEIEAATNSSKICFVALEIFSEYEIYCKQWTNTRKHIEVQRKLLSSKQRKKFLTAIEKRDGLVCADCGSLKDLQIDHRKPVSRGGLTVLENLQLLCKSCNSRKSAKEKGER